MSDLEQRLAAAGAAWRAEQQAPSARAHPRPRRWLPAAAAAAVVALALAAALVGDLSGGRRPTTAASSGGWVPMAASPLSARLNPVLTGWGDRVVVVGGDLYSGPCLPAASCVRDLREAPRDAALYDVPRDAWVRLPDAPLPLDVQSSAVLDDVLYLWLAGPDVVALDLSTRSWRQLPDPPAAGCCRRLTAAGDRLVAAPAETGRQGADLAWVPANGTWEALPPSPLDPSFDRTMTWTGEELVHVTPGRAPSGGYSGPPYVKAAVLRGGTWRALPAQEVVIGGWPEWSWTGDRLVVATTQRADGGATNGFGRSIPSGGYLDPGTGRWSELPAAPEAPSAQTPVAGGGRWVANGEGLVLDTGRERWHVLPTYEGQADQDAGAAWAAGRLVVWGGGVSTTQVDGPPGRSVATGAVWSPPQD